MDAEWVNGVILFFKFTAIALTGIFGCLALLTTYKDKVTGRPTRWGLTALIGIIVSTLVAAGSQTLEVVRSDIQAAGQRAQIARQLREIQRSIEPLETLAASYWLSVDLNDPVFAAYAPRMKSAVQAFLASQSDDRSGMYASRSNGDGPTAIAIRPESPAFPRKDNPAEMLAFYVLAYPELSLLIYSTPSALASGQWPPPSDLQVRSLGGEPTLHYDLETQQLEISVSNAEMPSQFWESNGKITSVLDFAKAQVVAHVRPVMMPDLKQEYPELRRARNGLGLRTLIVRLPRGRDMWLRRELLTEFRDNEGAPMYAVTLPEDFQISPDYRPEKSDTEAEEAQAGKK
jgi:hypothetical protein